MPAAFVEAAAVVACSDILNAVVAWAAVEAHHSQLYPLVGTRRTRSAVAAVVGHYVAVALVEELVGIVSGEVVLDQKVA